MELRRLLSVAILTCAACAAPAAAPATKPTTTAAESSSEGRATVFDAMKRFAGDWVVIEDGKRVPARLEVVAGGAALLQTSGFTAVYYPVGADVMVAFFPDDGYQARMRGRLVPGGPGDTPGDTTVAFELVDASNVRPGVVPSPGFSLELRADGKRMTQTWRFVDGHELTVVPLAFERPE